MRRITPLRAVPVGGAELRLGLRFCLSASRFHYFAHEPTQQFGLISDFFSLTGIGCYHRLDARFNRGLADQCEVLFLAYLLWVATPLLIHDLKHSSGLAGSDRPVAY